VLLAKRSGRIAGGLDDMSAACLAVKDAFGVADAINTGELSVSRSVV
jgi:hypothetical protein